MFLSYLNDTNKERFLEICVHAALSNEVFAEEEKETIAAYCREMNIDVHVPETKETFESLMEALSETATQKEKNIIVLETLALVKSDGVYDDKEQAFMSRLVHGLNVSEASLSKFVLLLDKYIEVGKELYSAISAE